MYRKKDSLMPVQYYNKLPRDQVCDIAYILDPCIATSGTINAVISIVKKWGAKKIVLISAIGAKVGVDNILAKHPDIQIHIAAIDNELSAEGMIVPGLGDAGDRQFCTPDVDELVEGASVKRKAETVNGKNKK
jgi:uracil phosphoribosyltransferase